ncbi:mitochondrial 2-oxoglutarate/malate carrier protein-like [Vanessa cardui]|uniref:mitochondrial 2-oxoglutarate/malate carrier protein-like n=1 Tax=Vanessa cardui TaxID=171605 RepID=UPI001F136E5A|nr:mitochondrial 2-oxoglutarate/malate carrier protein-like [Vanessa cardui]
MAQQLLRCKGFKALYAGLSAGLLRQITNTTTRLGVYHGLYNLHYRKYEKYPAIYEKIAIGITAGLAGAIAGHPSEVVLVRLMADGPLEPCIYCSCPKRYRGAFHALHKICKEEGMRALFRGGSLTLGRSVLVSVGQIGSYSQVREKFREKKLAKGLSLHIYTSFISSFLTAVFSLPIDLVKTKVNPRKSQIAVFGSLFLLLSRVKDKTNYLQSCLMATYYRYKKLLEILDYFWMFPSPRYLRLQK